MTALWVIGGFVAGFFVAWLIYTRKLANISAEVETAESWAIGDVRNFIDRIKKHL